MHKHAGTSRQCVNRVSRVMKLSAGEAGSEARVLCGRRMDTDPMEMILQYPRLPWH